MKVLPGDDGGGGGDAMRIKVGGFSFYPLFF